MKKILRKIFLAVGLEVRRLVPKISPIGSPAPTSPYSIENLQLNEIEKLSVENFRTDRYYWLNEYRWRLLLQAGIQIRSKSIFEPGAGIGDQTYWLLQQGASEVVVSDGRESNLGVIEKRFSGDKRVRTLLGDLEVCLDSPDFDVKTDFVFMWGVYYHIFDPLPDFPILRKISAIAPIVVMDYQESLIGKDFIENYDYENPSASISHASWRHTPTTIAAALKNIYGYVYVPVENMEWNDPSCADTPRRIIIGSKLPLNWTGIKPAI